MKANLDWQFLTVILLFSVAAVYLAVYIRRQIGGKKDSCPDCKKK